jgi:hypothetical protein
MRTEKIVAAFILLGFIFRFFHIPGSAIILTVSLMTISMIYFGGAFYFFCDQRLKNQNIALSIVSGFFLSLVQIGILYKVLFWPGGQIFLFLSIISTPVLLALTFFLKTKAAGNLNKYYKNMLLRIGVWALLTVFFYFIPAESLIKYEYKNDPERARLMILTLKEPSNLNYQKQYYEYMMHEDSMKFRNEIIQQ